MDLATFGSQDFPAHDGINGLSGILVGHHCVVRIAAGIVSSPYLYVLGFLPDPGRQ